MTETEVDNSNTLSGCVYVDANNSWEYFTSRLLFALEHEIRSSNKDLPASTAEAQSHSNVTDSSSIRNDNRVSVLQYQYQRQTQAQPLNDYKDPNFFSAAFLTLFLFEIGGPYCQWDSTRNLDIFENMGQIDFVPSQSKVS